MATCGEEGALCAPCSLPAHELTQEPGCGAPMETIVATAAQINQGLGKWMLTVSLPAPARHHDIIHPLYDLIGRPVGPNEQGFLTSKGRYVGRKRAMEIAVAAGQVDPNNRKSGSSSSDLFSEDLW